MKNQIDHLKLGVLVLVTACTLSYAESKVRDNTRESPDAAAPRAEASKDELKVSRQTLHNEVTDANKASKIIGMEVKNRENERVGRVKDIVIDVQSGKVAYAVLSTGFMGSGKLIAVPLDALTLQPGAKNFVINAPKDRIDAAPGFADNDWPGLDAAEHDRTIGLAASSAESDVQNAEQKTENNTTPNSPPRK
ncbi:MAG TPA: PRC-barrel domain-containing protein [Acidobacteriota bacterium]|nr:PRC-barrel domain-containing protein [Acidobacteriota bacterium]